MRQPRTPLESAARDLRWNFRAGVTDAAGWGLGMAFISDRTVLPLFVGELTDRPEAIGLVQTTMLLGWLLPGILIAGWLERQPRVRASVAWLAVGERICLGLMVPLCLWLGPDNRTALFFAFFACWLGMNALMGANMPGYYKLIVKTIPAGSRGRLYGIGGAVSGLLGAAAAPACGWFLSHLGYPRGYAACFAAATVAMTVSFLPLVFMREPEEKITVRHGESPSVLRTLALLRQDPRLSWLAASRVLFSAIQAAAGFYSFYAFHRFGLELEAVAGFTATQMIARTASNLLAGWTADHYGNRAVLRLATVAGILGAGIALASPDLFWMYAVLALAEFAIAGWDFCAMNYVLELCPTEKSGSYTALFNLICGPARTALPLLAGVLAGALGYPALFLAATVGGLLSLLLLVTKVAEPRHQRENHPIPLPSPTAAE